MRNPFSAPTVTELFLRSNPPADARFDEFFPYIRLPNGSFKTTMAKRHEDVDRALCGLLDTANSYRILDVAVSSGTGTVELSHRLSQAGIRHTMFGTDLTMWASYLRLPPVTVLFDENNFIYQVDIGPLAFPNTPPSRLSSLMFLAGKCLLKLHKCFFRGTKRTQLLSRIARDSNVLFETGDIFGQVVPETLEPKFDVIRASNVLNRSYFSTDQIAIALKNLRSYLNEGGLLVVNRTADSTNRFTVFRLQGMQFSTVLAENGGTEIEDIVGDLPTPIRLALVAWRGLPAALASAGTIVGGLETGAWELAQGLASLDGCQVTFVTEHSRAVPPRNIAGVDVHVAVNRWKELREDFSNSVDLAPKLRIKRLSWRLLYQFPVLLAARLWRAPDPPAMAADPRLLHIDCDVWACFGVNQDSARVLATARQQQRPCLLFLESNADLGDSKSVDSKTVDSDALNPYGVTPTEQEFCLTHASVVVCQSYWQLQCYRARFSLPSVLVRNPIRLDQWSPSRDSAPRKAAQGYVLWIGRYDDFHKRPLLALQIARLCPDIPFKLVINRSSSPCSADIEQQVRQSLPRNCTIIDYVPYPRMPEVFHAARVFLSTSSANLEGFPNVILQAAASGTPIVSLEDFDNFIHSSGAGTCSDGDIDEASRQLQLAWQRGTPPSSELVTESLRPFKWEFVARQIYELSTSLALPRELGIVDDRGSKGQSLPFELPD